MSKFFLQLNDGQKSEPLSVNPWLRHKNSGQGKSNLLGKEERGRPTEIGILSLPLFNPPLHMSSIYYWTWRFPKRNRGSRGSSRKSNSLKMKHISSHVFKVCSQILQIFGFVNRRSISSWCKRKEKEKKDGFVWNWLNWFYLDVSLGMNVFVNL